LAILTVLLAATAVAVALWPAAGFLAVAFFVILLPTSSIMPIVTEAAAERRMYLPLLPLLVGTVLGTRSALEQASRIGTWPRAAVNRIGWTLVLLVAVGYGVSAAQRNTEYRTERGLWQTVIERFPHARAYAALAFVNDQEGNGASVDDLYNEAIKAGDVNPQTRWNMAQSFAEKGDLPRAIEQFRQFVQLQPDSAEGEFALGHTLVAAGRTTDAVPHLQRALELDPGLEDAHATLGVVALQGGDFSRAASEFKAFLAIEPDDATVNKDLGLALMGERRFDDAIVAFRKALAIDPTIEDARRGLEMALKIQASSH
jgi:tetratricopeptide (TPR) repeat protein